MLFYGAMARGVISLVAPVTATVGATVPVAFSLVRGERPGSLALLGIGLAVLAVGLVSFVPGERITGVDGMGLALGAGAFFGLFYVFLSLADEMPGYGRSRSRASARRGARGDRARDDTWRRPGSHARPAVIAIAALEAGAAITLLLALQRGPVSIASVLASLYPVATTFLAAGLLHERLRPTQLVGVALRSWRS